jgi:chitodextrinase
MSKAEPVAANHLNANLYSKYNPTMKHRIPIHFLLLFIAWLFAGAAAAQTPVVDYPFEGNAKDESPNKVHAAVHAATMTTDRFGWANRAFAFDGVQAYLEAANSDALNTDYATVSFWIYVEELPAQGEAYLLSFGGWQERYKISLPPHGKLVWTTNSSSGISDMDAGAGNELPTGVWKHIAFVHDGTTDLIYIDGVQVASKNVAGTLNDTDNPLAIGYDPEGGANFFNGSIDDVLIFGEALSGAQIAALYAAQNAAPTVAQGLVASYPFDRVTGLDDTDFQNNLRLTDVGPATDRFGFGFSAAEFNGTSSEALADNSAQLNSDYTTVSFWVKPNELPATGEAFLLSHGGWQERWKISLPSHGKVVWTTNSTSGISDMDAGGGNELVAGEWTHVVVVHDGTNDKIFINGTLAASKAVGGTLNDTDHPLGIGFNPIDGGNWFNGVIDAVQIYNYAFNDAMVAGLYGVQSAFPGTPTDLVAEYPFAGDTDDATQFGNDALGTFNPTKDRFGYASNAAQFDGDDEMIALPSVALNSDYATISFWIRPDELPATGEAFILSHGGWQERWKISLPSHGKLVFTTNHENGISDMDAGNGNELTVGEWDHVVMVHDGAKDKIFINGVLVAQKDVVGKLNDTNYPLGIGWNPIDGGNFFKGALDEVQIYNRALSDAEVAALYTAQNTAPVINDELVADYTFDGDAEDESAYRNDAVVNGAQLTSDRFDRANQAYAFNGTSSEIIAQNSPQLNSPYTTVSFWINVAELPASGEAFLLTFGGWQERWKISLPQHGKLVWTTNNSSGISDMDAGNGNELPIGEWKHVVVTHDGTQDKIYIDGVLVASKNVAGTLNNTTKDLGMGFNLVDGGNYFKGSLDDVQIYNVALTDAEVAALHAAQAQAPAVTDAEAPCAPLNLAAEVEFNNVGLSWWAAIDNVEVVAYNVYQDGAIIATVEGTSIQLDGLTPLTDFEFAVTAVDAAGNESLPTSINVTTGPDETPDTTPPTAPGNLQGITGAHSVLLSWDPSTDNVIVSGYVVLVDGVVFDTLPGNATSALVNNLDSETPYTFEVYAFDLAGNNSPISEVTLTTDEEINTGEPGLVAWYPFEGNANDATPYNNHGAIGGDPVFEPATGHINGGQQNIKFDGVMDSVLVPNAVQLISDYATVSFWIRVDGINPADAESYVLDFGHWDERWKISLPQHHKIVWTTNGNNAQFANFISDMDSGDGNELVESFWWYVTMVHDGTNDIIYLNGEQVNIKPVPTKLNPTDNPFGMGSNPVEGGQYFNGGLDEVKLYNKALTAAEIQALYETGTTGTHDPRAELLQTVKQLYPNPAVDKLFIEHAFTGNQPLLLRIFDLQGRQVSDIRFDKQAIPADLLSVDVRTLPAGTYFLDFVVGGKDLGAMKFEKK